MASIKRGFSRGCAVLGLLLAFSGCSRDTILEVDTPDIIDPADLDNVTGAAATFAGAISELYTHITGPGSVAIFTGLFTDEVMHGSTPPEVRQFDLRDVATTNTIPNGFFLGLQRARFRNERAARILTDLVGAADKRVGEVLALAAWSYIFLAEMYCAAVPISDPETEELGNPLTTNQLLDEALTRLTSASASTAGDANLVNLIAVLRGRALLNKASSNADFTAAATAVANVPTGYQYQFLHSASSARQNNGIPASFTSEVYSVPSGEGGNGLNFASAGDPRVPTVPGSQANGLSRNDRETPMRIFSKYPSPSDPVTMASGIEARLIEAEALLKNGQVDPWLDKLNTARRTRTDLPDLPDPGAGLSDPAATAARVNLTFRERAFWMYLTAHRLGDLRRLIRQYGRGAETVFPTGAYHKQGLVRSTQVNFIVPFQEENNTNFQRAACNAGQA
jgi:hypothetical protein